MIYCCHHLQSWSTALNAFKTAVVTPLIKKVNLPSDDLKNYHPISDLSYKSKLVKYVVAK